MDNFNKKLVCVDSDDKIVGTERAAIAHTLDHLTLHRGFSLFLFNTSNELLIQQRSFDKYVFPGLWSNTVCSHPFLNPLSFSDPIKDIASHIIQRLSYELGITSVTVDDLHFVTRLRYKAVGDKYSGELLEDLPSPHEYFEMKESIKDDIDLSKVKWCEWEIDYIFICKKDVEVKSNDSEVANYCFINEDDYKMFIKTNKITPWKTLILKYINIFDIIKKI